ncbi:NUDIX hydrolase 6-like protein, partial [Tanacetum coccineum]
MEEINNFQQEPDKTLYQAWERFKELLMKCPQHYLTDMQEVILFYNGLDVPTRQKGVIPTKTVADAKVAIQEMAEYSQKWHNGTSRTRSTKTFDGLAAIQAQLNNLGREIKKVNEKDSTKEIMQTQNQGASIKTLEIKIGQMSKVLQKRGFGSLPSSTETNLRDHVKSISTTVEADMTPIHHIRSSQYAVSAQQNSKLMFESRRMTIPFPSRLNDCYCDEKKGSYGLQCLDAYSYGATRVDDSLPLKEKDPGSFTLPCYINNVCFENALADLRASVSVMPLSTYLNLGLGELAHTKLTVELADRTVKHPKGIAENVLVEIGKFGFPEDFIILNMPEDVKVPLILGRPFLSTAYAKIDVFKRKI